jgi:hypothetical protein
MKRSVRRIAEVNRAPDAPDRFLRSSINRHTKIASVTAPDIDMMLRR